MRRSNFALHLQPSLLEELHKAAQLAGVALNQLINVAVAEKVSLPRSGRRSQAGKWRMGEIQPVSAGKRKGPLLGSGAAPRSFPLWTMDLNNTSKHSMAHLSDLLR
jgi:hypothetical protein